MIYLDTLINNAKDASQALARATTNEKNHALATIADTLQSEQKTVLAANAKDVAAAKAANMDPARTDRLILNEARIAAMIASIQTLIALPDPIGQTTNLTRQPSGIIVGTMRAPIGVVGMIYESRPNVTMDAATLCLKAGNACILRGGREAAASNQALMEVIQTALKKISTANIPPLAAQLVTDPDRAIVAAMARAQGGIDVIIPRGGRGLIEAVVEAATVPVIKHLDGNCHTYLDAAAPPSAVDIAFNAKTHRYGVCNATETILVHEARADMLKDLGARLAKHGVEIRACATSKTILADAGIAVLEAVEADWYEEFHAPIVAVKMVADVDAAIAHINQYGSQHTDAILSADTCACDQFLREVDSASVIANASTRFADGFEYGLGAEIGISTDKFHVRGPVGLEGLTSAKYVVYGHGEIRA